MYEYYDVRTDRQAKFEGRIERKLERWVGERWRTEEGGRRRRRIELMSSAKSIRKGDVKSKDRKE